MKKNFCIIFAILLLIFSCIPAFAVDQSDVDAYEFDEEYYSKFKGQNVKLYVYNWGEYISDGSDDTVDVIKVFEDLTGIDVIYTTYDSNEVMFSKLQSGSAYYDIVIPSDYMISRLIKNDMLAKLDFDNIPNYKYIDESFKGSGSAYDLNDEYSVPYTWGMTGIIYNRKYVSEEDVGSWDLLWNEKYKDKILMFDNSRDAFAIAELLVGADPNTEDSSEIEKAAKKLEEQKPLVQAYVMDQVFNKMEEENAWIAPYYAGDYLTMVDKNPDLGFCFPKEGSNLFIDAMCVLKNSTNKEAAEMFINFMTEPVISAANCETIGYTTPSSAAKELTDITFSGSEIAYPGEDVLSNSFVFVNLSDSTNEELDNYWVKIVRVNALTPTFWVVVIVAVLAITAIIIVVLASKKKKMELRK